MNYRYLKYHLLRPPDHPLFGPGEKGWQRTYCGRDGRPGKGLLLADKLRLTDCDGCKRAGWAWEVRRKEDDNGG